MCHNICERIEFSNMALSAVDGFQQTQGVESMLVQPFKASRCIKASFYISENTLNFPTNTGFRMKISMQLVHQYMTIFFNFQTTSNHLHPLQVENCDSNSRLVVDEDDNGKFRPEGVNGGPPSTTLVQR